MTNKTNSPSVTATFIFSGLPYYWGGDGRRNDNDARCLFALYGKDTTLRDIIDSAVEDFYNGGDFYLHDSGPDPWADVDGEDVRAALLECLSAQGRADYDSGAISEFAADYADANNLDDLDDFGDYPVCIFLLEVAVCDEYGGTCEDAGDMCRLCRKDRY